MSTPGYTKLVLRVISERFDRAIPESAKELAEITPGHNLAMISAQAGIEFWTHLNNKYSTPEKTVNFFESYPQVPKEGDPKAVVIKEANALLLPEAQDRIKAAYVMYLATLYSQFCLGKKLTDIQEWANGILKPNKQSAPGGVHHPHHSHHPYQSKYPTCKLSLSSDDDDDETSGELLPGGLLSVAPKKETNTILCKYIQKSKLIGYI